MRAIRAFEAADGSIHLTAESAARHDFACELRVMFEQEPTIEELTINMDQIEKIIGKAKYIDTSIQRSA